MAQEQKKEEDGMLKESLWRISSTFTPANNGLFHFGNQRETSNERELSIPPYRRRAS